MGYPRSKSNRGSENPGLTVDRGTSASSLGLPFSPLFFGEGSPTKIRPKKREAVPTYSNLSAGGPSLYLSIPDQNQAGAFFFIRG